MSGAGTVVEKQHYGGFSFYFESFWRKYSLMTLAVAGENLIFRLLRRVERFHSEGASMICILLVAGHGAVLEAQIKVSSSSWTN